MAEAEAAWSWPENKIFEDALVKFPEEVPNRWQKIASCLPGKSPHDVIVHYNALLQDVADIEAGLVQLPPYSELPKTGRTSSLSGAGRQSGGRKKSNSWSEFEHKLFLRGLEIYGKSDWRSIARNLVTTRLPSQVASHAQKYFNRHKSKSGEKAARKRSSIHDITTVSDLDFANPSTELLSKASEQSAFTPSMAYATTNAYASTHPSQSSMHSLAFEDINNIIDLTSAVMAIQEPDAVVPAPNPSIHES